jgi:hypothetical protein
MIITCIDSSDIFKLSQQMEKIFSSRRDLIGFRVIDDFGNDEYWYDSSRFEPVEITRNNILEDLDI